MDIERPPPLRETATRFARAISLFANSEAGSKVDVRRAACALVRSKRP
jgi:hypothetical protein